MNLPRSLGQYQKSLRTKNLTNCAHSLAAGENGAAGLAGLEEENQEEVYSENPEMETEK